MDNSKIYSKILFTQKLEDELRPIIEDYPKGKVFLATEETINQIWGRQYESFLNNLGIKKVILPSGEQNKKIESVAKIWSFLSQNGGDRKSLLINIGGGMLTDLAGFAATTFKRGIDFLNIPTTLLSQVDASVGGKTGINFNGLKNEVGTFKEPIAVIINTDFLKTINNENFISGYAEMIKHGLIHDPDHLNELKEYNFETLDYTELQEIIRHSVEVKKYFVANDLTEKNIRKALNFGHTVGHAIESFAMQQNRPILHGYAVAYGMIAELYLSERLCNFPLSELKEISQWILSIYGKFEFLDTNFETLFEYMTHDKKNDSGRINFTLLSKIGSIEINQHCEKEIIFEALDFLQKL